MSAEDRNGEVSTDEKCTDCTTQERSFDELTRGLASATVSRRGALRLLAGALFGGMLASVPGVDRTAQALEAPGGSTCVHQGNSCAAQHCCEGLSCLEDTTSSAADKFCCPDLPLQIVCGKHCCPTGAVTCNAGNCVCPPASPNVCPDPDNINFAGKCTDTDIDVLNCGACGIACPEPDPNSPNAPCLVRACEDGQCKIVARPDPPTGTPRIPCEDGNPCTVGDTCNNGTCQSGTPVSCEQCFFCDPQGTTPTCVPDPGQVGHSCDDENACTADDECTANVLGVPTGICAGTQISCDDNNECTTDTCNPATGCVNTPRTGARCNESNRCRTDFCDANGDCQQGPATVTCTQCRICNPENGTCVANPLANDTPCENEDICIAGGTCNNGTCQGGTPITGCCTTDAQCNDNNPCTTDTCNTTTNTCVFTPKANCCTTNAQCNDNNPCTTDTCNTTTNTCVFTPRAGCCTTNAQCTGTGQICCATGMHANTCKGQTGASCGGNGQCCSNRCRDGVCT